MDRRASLAVLFGQNKTAKKTTATPPIVSSLAPYTGTWDWSQAAHLLRRTTFGSTYPEIQTAVADGLEGTIKKLFASQPLPNPPVYYDFENDPNVAVGETWVNTPPAPNVQGLSGARRRSLNAWMYSLMFNGGVSIREKMVLFWHNHFVTAQINRNQYRYHYIDTIRKSALGNFKTLTEEITISPAMLVYLNGNQNTRRAPNENYSRELLELFTIGKGDIAGPGDYTNYTEDDVIELAKALTGWINRNTDGLIKSTYVRNRHEVGDKQLSHRFDNVVITNGEAEEYKQVIDIIFQKDEVARFISRRLHVWFVGSNIDSFVEAEIIEPMAAMIRDNNYEIQPALEALLSSEYFYEEGLKGCMINHPIDFLFKLFKPLKLNLPQGDLEQYNGWNRVSQFATSLEMDIFNHPTVAGWKAFYQGPQFYDVWINSVSLPLREGFTKRLINGFNFRQFRYELNILEAIAELDNPSDPHELIGDLGKTFFVHPIAQNQLDYLTDYLIQGNPYYVWSEEYGEYLADPTNEVKRNGVLNKLENLIEEMMKMPEFYLT